MTSEPKLHTCECCGGKFPLRLLDAKPASLAGKPATYQDLTEASDRGEDFETLECQKCYGPAWAEGVDP